MLQTDWCSGKQRCSVRVMLANSQQSSSGRFMAYMVPWRSKVMLASTYSVINKLFDIAPEVLIGVAVDVVVKGEDSFLGGWGLRSAEGQLTVLAVLTFLIWACESIFEYLHKTHWRNLAQDVQHHMRLQSFQHVQRLGLGWFEGQHRGEIATVLGEDVNQVERFLNTGINDILQVITSSIVVSLIFFYLSPSIAIFALIPIPIIIGGAAFFQRRLEPHYRAVRKAAGLLGAQLATTLSGIATIKSYTAEEQVSHALTDRSTNYQKANYKAIVLSSSFVPLIRMAILSGFLVTMVLGGWQAIHGYIAVGSYSVMVFLTQRLLWPFTRLGETVDLYQRSMASVGRVLNLLDNTPEPQSGRVVGKDIFDKPISFEKIYFEYADRESVIRDVSLAIEPGRYTGIVGATGSGKSTLFKLLLRFYEPTSGRVCIGGEDVGDMSLQSLRQHIGFVSQDAYLLPGTIVENIALAQPHASMEAIQQAAELAEVDAFVRDLPDGYETNVGEQGQRLSAGQRQRIALARAILKDAPILLLDEATSAVDNETEAAIIRALHRVAQGRTVIAIAHRLSTVRHADIIHVLENGVVSESGAHDQLVEQGGTYRRLWALQTGESTEVATTAEPT